jgi:F0F1-type ATP synthase membrane subunit a
MANETISGIIPKVCTLSDRAGMFILICNLIGLVPGLESPTAVPIVPLGCALLTWFYYHYQGIRDEWTDRISEAFHRAAR